MSFLALFFIAFCTVALFCGLIGTVGKVVIALLGYVVLPVTALIAILFLIKSVC